MEAGFKLGGKKVDVGDIGIEINVLPNVSMVFGLWTADDEIIRTAKLV